MLVPGFMYFGAALYSVVLPLLVVDLGGRVIHYAALNAIYNTVYAVASWVLPSVLRGLSRKSVLAVCYGVLAAIAVATAYAPSIAVVIALQVPYALGAALATVLQTNVFVELWRGRRGVTLLYIATSLGWIASLATGSAMRSFVELQSLFLVSSAGFLVAALATLMFPPTVGIIEAQRVVSLRSLYRWVVERVRMLNPLTTPRPSFRIGRLTALKLFLIAVGVTYIAIGAFFTALPIYLKKVVKVGDTMFLALSATAGLASLALYFVQLRVAERLELVWRIHIAVLAVRSLLFACPQILAAHPHCFFILYAALGATWAFIGSVQSMIASSLAPPGRKDEILGNMNASMSIGLVIGYAVATLADIMGYATVFAITSVLIAIAAVLNLYSVRYYRLGLV